MQFWESILQALSSLKSNKLRSLLTLVGIIIGVMTVISVVSIINGMNRYVASEIANLGSNTFYVDKFGIITSDDAWWKALKRKNFKLEDMEPIAANCPDCDRVGAYVQTWGRVKHKNKYLSQVEIYGSTANINEIMDYGLPELGRTASEFEVEHKRSVALIGSDIASRFFPNLDPIGKEIKIKDSFFTIIGVAKKRGSFLGQNQDYFVRIPITSFQKIFGDRRFLGFAIRAKDQTSMERAMDQVRLILRARRHVPYHDPDDFGMYTSGDLMNLFKSFSATAFLVMIGISSISLLVGGIGIMNIMFVSVTERTKEIGIRKAMGARRKDVLWQFLVEAISVALVGGVIGIILGGTIAKLVSLATPLPSSVELWSVIAGVMIALGVGVFFGIYPAMKAARLSPIDALRYE